MPTYVDFRSVLIGPPSRAVVFQDSLIRATGFGPNWQVGYQDFTQASNQTCTSCLPTGAGLLLQTTGLGGTAMHFPLLALPLFPVNGKTQFAEVKYIAFTGSDFNAGPMVAFNNNSKDATTPAGYFCALLSVGAKVNLFKTDPAETVIQLNVCALAINDVIRIAVQFENPVGSNTITVFRNGVSQGTFADNSASRAATGMPGIYVQTAPNARSITLANFRGGPGLGS